MNQYHKIKNVFCRDENTHKLIPFKWRNDTFHCLSNCVWVATEKIDGTNIRVIFDGEKVIFKGKSDNAQIPGPLVEHLTQFFTLELMKSVFSCPVCLYGEGFGGKIQKGSEKYGVEQRFILFDVSFNRMFTSDETMRSIAKSLGCDCVEILYVDTLTEIVQQFIDGNCRHGKYGEPEGVVARPIAPLYDHKGNRVIVKIKVRDFEVKGEK